MAGFKFGNSPPLVVDFTSSSEVTVDHNLGYYPVVWVMVDGHMHFGTVQYTTINQVVVTFQLSISGSVHLR
jgi:hypothetical protein